MCYLLNDKSNPPYYYWTTPRVKFITGLLIPYLGSLKTKSQNTSI